MADAFTPEQIQYLQDHADDTLVPSIHIANGICVAAATISVILRYLARRSLGTSLGRDDYCLFIAYVLYVAFAASLGTATRYGEGRHVNLVTDFRTYAIVNLLQASFYVFGMAFVKCSILFLYHRIFPGKTFRNVLLVAGAIVFSWAMAAFFPSIMSCYPVEKAWDSSIPGRCIDYGIVTLVIGILNVIMDFAMLSLPMPLLWKLRMSTRRKAYLSGIFAVGCIACVVSIARLFYAKEASMSSSRVLTSSGQETSIYDPSWIVACCAITYRPLIERVFGSSTSKNSPSASSDAGSGWKRIHVQHDVIVREDPGANTPQPSSDPCASQEWELRPVRFETRLN
ncbi:hypothetical protein LA080_003728 [Diaporthe eres]|nr:hypothetical protein LA080_003728 [Diaporthe eres]